MKIKHINLRDKDIEKSIRFCEEMEELTVSHRCKEDNAEVGLTKGEKVKKRDYIDIVIFYTVISIVVSTIELIGFSMMYASTVGDNFYVFKPRLNHSVYDSIASSISRIVYLAFLMGMNIYGIKILLRRKKLSRFIWIHGVIFFLTTILMYRFIHFLTELSSRFYL